MSVCIVHRDGWAVCDSRSTTMGGTIFPGRARKIFKVKNHSLVAAVGSAFIGQSADILCNDKEKDELLADLGIHMMNSSGEGCLLMVDEDGYMAEICGEGSVQSIDESMNYWAIGSASDLVIGFLEAVEQITGAIDVEDAEQAIIMASRFKNSIDDRVQTFYLSEQNVAP